MKKFLLTILIIYPFVANGQVISPNNPYTENFIPTTKTRLQPQAQQQQNNDLVRLEDITQSFDLYWKNKDYRQKGSGYKPFKRWAAHWSHYLQADGTIAPPSKLWSAWEQKIQSEAQVANANVPTPNWTNLGPSVVTNSSVSISGQGRVNAIAKDPSNPNTIYVGAPAGGIWRSTDDGLNWTPLSDHLPQIGVSGIAVDPNDANVIYISTGDDDAGDSYSIGVMKTIDGGTSWNTTGLQFNNLYKGSSEIFIDPTDSNMVWVATSEGLYKTSDGGDQWTNKLSGNIVDFRLQPGNSNTLFAVGYDNDGGSKFYKTTDGGNNFTEIVTIPDNANRIVLEVTAANPNIVYVLSAYDNGDGTYQGRNSFQGVYKSTDAGETFVKTAENDDIFQSAQSWYDMALTVSDTDPDIVFVGVLDIWKSTDGGDDFSQLNYWNYRTAAFTHADIHFMRYFDGVLYAGTDGGIYRSNNDGSAFEDLSNTLSIAQIYTVSTSRPDSSKLAGGLQDCGGFALSGTQWNSYHGGDGMGSAIDPFQEDWYYGMTQNGGSLYRNKLGGSGGWSQSEFIASGPTDGNWVTPMQFNKNGDLYAGYDQLYVLQGGSWQQVSNHAFGENIRHIEIDPNNINNIYVSTNYTVYKSMDRGVTFTAIYDSSVYVIRTIEIHHTNSDIIWILESDGLVKSTDGGDNFVNISPGLPSEFKRVLKHQPYSDHDALYLGTTLGVYYYDNLVGSWTSISQDLPNVEVSDLEINVNDNTLTASTYGRGVWQTPIPTVNTPQIDVDLLAVNIGSSDYKCDDSVNPSIRIYNNGSQDITELIIKTNLNGTEMADISWDGLLQPNQWETIELESLTGLQPSANILEANLVLNGDTQTQNNLSNHHFDVDPSVNDTGIINNTYTYDIKFENWLVVGDPLWEKGAPTGELLNQTVSGSMVYGTNLSGNYPDQINSELVSPCFDLSLLSDPVVRFHMAYDIELDWDYLYFEYSTDKGNQWTTLAQYTGTDISVVDLSLNEYSFDVSNLEGMSNVIFRFKLVSDTYINNEGAIIDDFVVEGITLSNKDTFGNKKIIYYPNPTLGNLTIRIDESIQDLRVAVRDIRGSLLMHLNINVFQSKNIDLDLSEFANGVYFVEVMGADTRQTLKVIKQ